MIEYHKTEPKAPPATAFDGDAFYSPIAAAAATEMGQEDAAEQMGDGAGVFLVPVCFAAACVALFGLLSWSGLV